VLVPLALIAVATLHDLASREIPDWVAVLIFGWGLVVAAFTGTTVAWTSLLIGGLLGFALTAPLFWLGGIGGGDVKLITALGACLGPGLLLLALFWAAVFGGGLAFVAKLRGKADFAYVPAILAGLALALLWPGAFNHVLAK
jgi:Flp pilus assembly protein protease CpaA